MSNEHGTGNRERELYLEFMKKLFIIIFTALIGLLVSCPNSGSNNPNNKPVNPDQKTFIVFDNTQGICAVSVYDDYRRRDEDKIADILAGKSSHKIGWTPGDSIPFYFKYSVTIKGINDFSLNYVPEIGRDQKQVRIDIDVTTTIKIPTLSETFSSSDTLLSNNSYLLIQNNSSYPFRLHRGDSPIKPDNLPASLVNSREKAQYTINPGPASHYQLMAGTDYKEFPSSINKFEAGHIYYFDFIGSISLVRDTELKLENVNGFVIPKPPAAPVVIVSNGSLALQWAAVESATAYEIWMSTVNDSSSALKYGTDIAASLTATINGLDNGTAYYIWLKAKNNLGTSGFSPVAIGIPSASTVKPPDPMTAPSIIAGNGQLNVSWQAVEDTSAYEIWTGTTNDTQTATKRGEDISGLSAVISGLNNGTIYYVWIKAKNNIGVSGFSPPATGKPLGIPGRPTLSSGPEQLLVTWTAVAGADEYEVYYGLGTPTTLAATTAETTATITGLTNGMAYYVRLRAKNVNGVSNYGPSASGVPIGNAGIVTVNSGDSQLSLSWTVVAGADQYEVYYSTINTIPANPSQTVTTTAATISGLTNGTTYYVWIKPKNANGSGNTSTVVNGVPMTTPGNLTISAGNQQITISWSAVSGANSYEVYYSTTTTIPTTASFTVTGLSRTITGLTNGTTYNFWVKTVNATGTGEASTMASGKPIGNMGTVTLVMGSGQMTASWSTVAGADQYEVYHSTTSTMPASPSLTVATTMATIISLTNGTTYYVWVKPKNANGYGNTSTVASGKPFLGIPGVPGVPTVSPGYKSLIVTWTAVAEAEQYEVYYGTDIPTTLVKTITGTTTTIGGLLSGTTYYVRLRAKNASGVSDYGPNASGVPNSVVPAPGLYRGAEKIGNQNLTDALSWISSNAVSGDDFYIVLGADESISPKTLSYSSKTVGITLLGYGGERTITLSSNGSMFTLSTHVTLTLDENITLVGRSTNNTSLVYVSGGSLIMNDRAKISGNTNTSSTSYSYGGGVRISSGIFTMNGGKIISNTTVSSDTSYFGYGGGVYGNGGTFTMNGGEITGNNSGLGGGVSLSSSVTFIMNGGKISKNTTSNSGGGICINSGTVTINGGTISGNISSGSGGGILMYDGTLIMYGGIISGNAANHGGGGGIFVNFGTSNGTFRKLTPSGGQGSGIIYGSEQVGVDADGIQLKNTSIYAEGHAICSFSSPKQYRNTTAGETDQIDTTSNKGLSANGNSPYGQ